MKSIHDLVCQDIAYRKTIGQQRYGVELHAYNGRSALLDAYEEALDLACYLRQAIEELTTVKPGTQQLEQPPEEPHHRACRSN